MPVRIERLKIKRNGPLTEDLEIRPADLNLIFGPNESGKTYVLETMISFLFATGRGTAWDTTGRSDRPPDIRDFPRGGKALVSGLEDQPVSFTKTGEKLDRRFATDAGLPPELSRLVVVRAGESRLSGDSSDGVGREVLMEILGGRELLEEIDSRIGKRSYGLRLIEGSIDGHKAAISSREDAAEKLRSAEMLLGMVQESDAALQLSRFRREMDKLKERLHRLHLAKRHHAWRLRRDLTQLERELDRLPSARDVSELERSAAGLSSRRETLRRKRARLEEESERLDALEWASHARDVYARLMEDEGDAAANAWPLWGAAGLMVAAVTLALLRVPVLAIVCAAASLGALTYARRSVRPSETAPWKRREMEEMAGRYSALFGEEMAGLASLAARQEEFGRSQGSVDRQRDEIEELSAELDALRERVLSGSSRLFGDALTDETLEKALNSALEQRQELEERRKALELEIAALGVPEKAHLEEDPGIPWSATEQADIEERVTELQSDISRAEQELQTLRTRLAVETRESEATEWTDLLEALRRRVAVLESAYRAETSDLLARAVVASAVQEMRGRENRMLEEKLSSESVSGALKSLTGRYDSIGMSSNGCLTLGIEGETEYGLEELSTGAREQVYLALRAAFAEMTFKQPAFLLLDDAFQHSDWKRRDNLVAHCLGLLERGWQIFYFCMDNDIRDRFLRAGEALGKRFKLCQLAES